MTLSERDRRALLILGFAGIGVLLYVLITDSPAAGEVDAPRESISSAEKRLDRMRKLAAQVPGREEIYKQVSAQLAAREKRILQADTAAQAQAQLLQTVRRVAHGQSPAVEIRASEFGNVRPLGDNYGEVPVTVTIECGIEQLLNIVTELTTQPEITAVSEMRIYSANQKQKTTNVRLSVSAVVPKRLVPEKKGASF